MQKYDIKRKVFAIGLKRPKTKIPRKSAGLWWWGHRESTIQNGHATGAVISALFTWVSVDKYIPSGVNISVNTENVRPGFKTEF